MKLPQINLALLFYQPLSLNMHNTERKVRTAQGNLPGNTRLF